MTDKIQHSYEEQVKSREQWNSKEYLETLVDTFSTVRLDKDVIVNMERTANNIDIVTIYFFNDKNQKRNIPEGFQIRDDSAGKFLEPRHFKGDCNDVFILGYIYNYTIMYKGKKIVELNRDKGKWTLNNVEYYEEDYKDGSSLDEEDQMDDDEIELEKQAKWSQPVIVSRDVMCNLNAMQLMEHIRIKLKELEGAQTDESK